MKRLWAITIALFLLGTVITDASSYVQPPPSMAGLKGLRSVVLDIQVLGLLPISVVSNEQLRMDMRNLIARRLQQSGITVYDTVSTSPPADGVLYAHITMQEARNTDGIGTGLFIGSVDMNLGQRVYLARPIQDDLVAAVGVTWIRQSTFLAGNGTSIASLVHDRVSADIEAFLTDWRGQQ
ncbi:MAG: hypothetical protein AAB229_10430 [Candidatus Hydrogenedentota bacterium]